MDFIFFLLLEFDFEKLISELIFESFVFATEAPIEYILNEFQSDYPPRISYPKNGKPVYSISFSSGKIRDVFHKFNILERKTKTYSLPDCIDDVYLPAFLAGYIEGDGCITIAKDKAEPKYLCVSFVGTKQFIEECAKRIPVPGHVRKHSQSDVYEIRWNSKNAVDFCGWIYGDRDLYHSYKLVYFRYSRRLIFIINIFILTNTNFDIF